jgi:pre-mRNA-splicing factor CDC5/CEF1
VEEALIKRDVKRQKVEEAHDAPGVLARDAAASELQMVRRRTKMMLPSPQVGAASHCSPAAMPATGCAQLSSPPPAPINYRD